VRARECDVGQIFVNCRGGIRAVESHICRCTIVRFYGYDLASRGAREASTSRNRRQSAIRGKGRGQIYSRDTICEFTIRLRAGRITAGYSCESGYDPARIGSDISGRNVVRERDASASDPRSCRSLCTDSLVIKLFLDIT
jgi:hypothetical protein